MEEFLLLIGLRLQLETFGAVPNCPNVAEKFIPENSISTFLFRCRDKKIGIQEKFFRSLCG
jgi:hypothetical protein